MFQELPYSKQLPTCTIHLRENLTERTIAFSRHQQISFVIKHMPPIPLFMHNDTLELQHFPIISSAGLPLGKQHCCILH